MTSYISDALRTAIEKQAKNRCEYCLIAQSLKVKRHEVDHIYAEKHSGETVPSNLCLSCANCNRNKGSDLCSLDPLTKVVTPLFHPRVDTWEDHFQLEGATLKPLSAKGRVTVKLLQINHPDRVAERAVAIRLHLYP